MTQKNLTLVTLGFITILIIIGAYFLFVKKVQNENQTATWKTYTNSEDGYEFMYPAEYNITAEGGTVSIENQSHAIGYIYIFIDSPITEEIQSIKDQIKTIPNAKLISENHEIINGHGMSQIVVYYPEAGTIKNVYNYFEDKGRTFTIGFRLTEEDIPYDQILSTFEFRN